MEDKCVIEIITSSHILLFVAKKTPRKSTSIFLAWITTVYVI